MKQLISPRYSDDGREAFPLTQVQLTARNRIVGKLSNGIYQLEMIKCPLCKSIRNKKISEKDAYGIPTAVVLCTDCELVYNNPRLSESSLNSFYRDDYRELDRALPSIEAYYLLEHDKGERIYQFLNNINLTDSLNNKLILEVGCGAGGVIGRFRDRGFSVMGCDLVPDHLEYGRDEKRLSLYYGRWTEVNEIAIQKSSDIGLVIYEQVFEHLADPRHELKQLCQRLGPDSLLYIGVPGLRNIDNHYRSDFLRYLQLPHLAHYDMNHLVSMLQLEGLSLLGGNELVQAVFRKDNVVKYALPYYSENTIAFLTGLEQRRQQRAKRDFVRLIPHNLLKWLWHQFIRLPLPNDLKIKIRYILRSILHLKEFV